MKKTIGMVLCLAIMMLPVSAFGGADEARAAVREYIAQLDTGALQAGYLNGEWKVLAAARSGEALPEGWQEAYYSSLCVALRAGNGDLNERRYTDYSRTVIGLTAIGRDPRNAAGYNVLAKLADYEAVKKQGLNGSIYALIALDCGGYEIPRCADGRTQATRELYIEHILSSQNPDGSFSLTGEGDSDITAMALQALSDHRADERVEKAVERALEWLSAAQCADGGFATVGEETCESAAQVLTALGELGIDPDTDPRFIKNGRTVADNILSYRLGTGGFRHTGVQTEPDPMASEQAVYALVSYIRQCEGSSPLYDMAAGKENSGETAQRIQRWLSAFSAKQQYRSITTANNR